MSAALAFMSMASLLRTQFTGQRPATLVTLQRWRAATMALRAVAGRIHRTSVDVKTKGRTGTPWVQPALHRRRGASDFLPFFAAFLAFFAAFFTALAAFLTAFLAGFFATFFAAFFAGLAAFFTAFLAAFFGGAAFFTAFFAGFATFFTGLAAFFAGLAAFGFGAGAGGGAERAAARPSGS